MRRIFSKFIFIFSFVLISQQVLATTLTLTNNTPFKLSGQINYVWCSGYDTYNLSPFRKFKTEAGGCLVSHINASGYDASGNHIYCQGYSSYAGSWGRNFYIVLKGNNSCQVI